MTNNDIRAKFQELVDLVKTENPGITYLTMSWLNEDCEDYYHGYADGKDGSEWRL